MARVFMNLPQEHLFKGIGWYFYNGAMVRSRRQEIFFIGRLENFEYDFSLLIKRLGLAAESNQAEVTNEKIILRKADASKKCLLTREGRANIIKWYEPTDYSALMALHNDGHLSFSDLDYYCK